MIRYTQAMVDELTAAIAQGVTSVAYSGPPARTVTYASLADMRAQLVIMNRAVDGVTTQWVFSAGNGFDPSGRCR